MKSKILCILACVAASSPVAVQADAKIERELQVGKTYQMVSEMSQSMKMEMGGQKMDNDSKVTTELKMAVTAGKEPGKRNVTMTYERMAMDMVSPGQSMKYDSAKPDEAAKGPLGEVFGKLIGKSITMVLNEKFEVEKLDGMEALTSSMGPMAKMFSKETFSQMMTVGNLQAPNRVLKPGDKWPLSFSMNAGGVGNMEMKGECTYVKDTALDGINCAEIEVKGTLGMKGEGADKGGEDPQSQAMKALGMQMEGKFTTRVFFDSAAKIERKTEMTSDLTMTMKNPQKPGEKMTIPMKQTMTQKVKPSNG